MHLLQEPPCSSASSPSPPPRRRLTTRHSRPRHRVAQRVERLGFAGLWTTDAFARGTATVDPLMFLSTLCGATERIELGTCVTQVPLRHPVELAHRAQTLHLLSRGRFRFGVGSGSTKHDFDACRSTTSAASSCCRSISRSCARCGRASRSTARPSAVWPGTEGGPPVYLGAWRSPRWIDLAAKHCHGWIASGIHGAIDDLPIGLDMFRKAGGKRAILANIFTDLRPDPPAIPVARAKVTLVCAKSEARDRLRRIQDLGFDDALMIVPFGAPEMLDEIRELLP